MIADGRDACFNLTEGSGAPALANGVVFTPATDAQPATVAISIAHLFPGQPFRLICRLVNNDGDRDSTVHLVDAELTAEARSGILLASDGPTVDRARLLPSRSGSGEHTRPRVSRSAPSPIGFVPTDPSPRPDPMRVAGEAPATAPKAGALPSKAGSSSASVRQEPRPTGSAAHGHNRRAIALASDPSPSSGSSLFSLAVVPPPAEVSAGSTILLTGRAASSYEISSLPYLDLIYGLKGRDNPREDWVLGIPTHLFSFRSQGTTFQDHGIVTLDDQQIYVDGLAVSSEYGLTAFQVVADGTGSRLVTLNVANARAAVIGPFLAGREISGASFDACDNLWATDCASNELLQIDPTTGEILGEPVALKLQNEPYELLFTSDLAIDRTGRAFLSDWSRSVGAFGSGVIFALDPGNGALVEAMRDLSAESNSLVPPQPQGLAFLSTGTPDSAYIFDGNYDDDVYVYEAFPSVHRSKLFTVMLDYNGGPGDLASLMPPINRHRLARVTVNDQPVDALDSTGQFFSRVTIAPGRNDFTFNAMDACGQAVTTTVSVFGTQPTEAAVEFSVLSDVSSSLSPDWGRTSFNEEAKTLFAELSIRNTGHYPVKAPLLLGIARISDPSVRLLNADGYTQDGTPYLDFSSLITGEPSADALPTGHSTLPYTLAFHNPRRTQFTFELVVLGQLNRPPAFTTVPVIEAIVGQPYNYAFEAADPDGDSLSYFLPSGPAGLALSPQPSTLSWSPAVGDVGTHNIRLRAEDGHGGWAEQAYVLSVTEPPPNRPPYFTSVPVVEAFVNKPYIYGAVASDPDKDSLTFALPQAPAGMALGTSQPPTPDARPLEWLPSATEIGNHSVTVRASDGRGGTATQSYVIRVLPDPANHPPVIVSEPVTEALLAEQYTYDVEAIDPDLDVLNYSLPIKPVGMSIDASTGLITWIPQRAPGYTATAFNVGSSREDTGSGIATDSDGNFYMCGHFQGTVDFDPTPGASSLTSVGDTDVYVAKYNPNGTLVWARRAGGPGQDRSHDVTVDGQGNVYVIGHFTGTVEFLSTTGPSEVIEAGYRSAFLLKVNALGDFMWVRIVKGDPEAAAWASVKVDHNGDVVTAGEFSGMADFDPGPGRYILTSAGLGDVFIWKLDSEGRLCWARRAGGDGRDTAWSLSLDAFGNVYSTGIFNWYGSDRPVDFDPGDGCAELGGIEQSFIWTLTSDGAFVRANQMQGTLIEIDVDAARNMYVQGVGGLRKLDAQGRLIWQKAGGTAVGLRVDQEGNVYTHSGWDGAFLVKYSADGQLLWTARYRTAGNFVIYGLALSPGGIVRSTGWFADALELGTAPHSITLNSVGANDILHVAFTASGDIAEGVTRALVRVEDRHGGSDEQRVTINVTAAPLLPDLIVGNVNRDRLTVDPQTLAATGKISATVMNQGPATVTGPFDVLFFEDVNQNHTYDANTDTLLDTASVPGPLAAGASTEVSVWGAVETPQAVGPFMGSSTETWESFIPDIHMRDPVSIMSGAATISADFVYVYRYRTVWAGTSDWFGASEGCKGVQLPGYGPVEIEFTPPVTRFGAYWAAFTGISTLDPARQHIELTSASGSQSQRDVTYSDPRGQMHWHGWQDPDGIARIRITSTGGWAGPWAMDGLQADQGISPPIFGIVTLPGTVVWARVDNGNSVAEANEANNLARNVVDCRVEPPDGQVTTDPAPDLTACYIRLAGPCGQSTIWARVGNGGEVQASPGVRVAFYEGDPKAGGVSIGVVSTSYPIAPDAFEDVSLTIPGSPPTDLWVVADDDGTGIGQVNECDEGNNSHSVTLGESGLGEIRGTVFDDLNNQGLPGWVVYLDTTMGGNWNGHRDPTETYTVTDSSGAYSFTGLLPTTYHVALEVQPGWIQTFPPGGVYPVTLAAGQVVAGLDFANRRAAVNRQPFFTSLPPTVATVAQSLRYDARATDPDGDPLRFDLALGPGGMMVHTSSGAVFWTPVEEQVGLRDVLLRVQDTRGGIALQSFQISVKPRNTPPHITSVPAGPAVVGQPWQYVVRTQDAENDPVTLHLVEHPADMALSGTTVSWTPGAGDVGSRHVAVMASDGLASTTQSFDLPVVGSAPNHAPTITSRPPGSVRFGDIYRYPIQASDRDGDPVTFALPQAPEGMAVDTAGLVIWTPNAAQLGTHTVRVVVADGRGGSVTQEFSVSVSTERGNQPPNITSSPQQSVVVGNEYRYAATANDPDNDLLAWNLETKPDGMSIDPQQGLVLWTPTIAQLGDHAVVLRVMDTQGAWASQSSSITVRAVNLPPQISSVPSTKAATDQPYFYAVLATDRDADPLSFSLPTAPAGMTIAADSGFVEWTPTGSQLGTHKVLVRVTDGESGVAEQPYEVVVSAEGNRHPSIASEPPFLAVVEAPYLYPVTATDPDGDPLTYQLLASPPGMTIIEGSGLVQWTPGGAHLGNHTVTVAAVDPDGARASQTFNVTVLPVNQPPAITSAPIQQVPAGTAYRYDVRATDPDGDVLTYALTGPARMSIDQFGRLTWSPRIEDAGEHLIIIRVSDPFGASAEQRYVLAVTADTTPPFVRIGRGADRLPVGTILAITAAATDNSGRVTLLLTIGGVPVPLNAQGYAEVVLNVAGTFEVLARATDPSGNVGQDSFMLTVFDSASDPDFPVVEITAPEADAVITAPVSIVGTANDANLLFYKLEVGPPDGGALTEIGRGTISVVNGVLGRLDPTTLANDSYRLVLTAQDASGNIVSTETTFNVAGELKIGNFSLSFVDLSIPVSGIPITVGRTYDSLNAGQPGEFGYGWRLEFREVNLRNNLPPRQDYEAEFGIYPAFTERTRVYVTVPGGRRQGFTFRPVPMSGFASIFGFYKPAFVPDSGVTSTLTVEAGPSVVLMYINSLGEYQALIDGGGGTMAYNPEDPLFGGGYTLTTKEGVAYRIDGATRLVTQVFDAVGNTLTFTDAAVISSAGPKVEFTRDPQGRIIAVKDPAGKSIQYQYDSQGDLMAVTDREGNKTQFKYENPRPHYLTEVIDPLGRSGVRTEYDEQGRLVKLKDAAGNPVELVHDLDNSMEKVVDTLGHTTTFVYDARGNVVQEVNALGGETRREYDEANNMTREKDALGNVTKFTYDGDGNVLTRTDPLGNVTLNTYTRIYPRGWFNFTGRTITLLATTTDPFGNTTKNDYDTAGNLVATTDALGKVTRYEYDGAGNQTKITDVAGNVTQFAYDSAGRLTQQTDALGNVTTFTYDANGNQLTQTSTLTTPSGLKSLVTSTTYNANGRPTSVTDAAGNVTRTEYDALGKTKATIDGLGHRTEFEYDERGQLVRTVFADNTFSQLAYDAAGRRTFSADRAGRTTAYEYDALGRLVKTTYPATDVFPRPLGEGEGEPAAPEPEGEGGGEGVAASTSTSYDLAGRVIAQTDELGHTTLFGYDASGRQTSITNALGHVTRSEYDTAGRKIADFDTLGRKTQFEYDALGRRVKTTFADNTTKQTAYDSLGRVTAETDQAGVKTQFEYDALGRLTAVVDALGGRTEYGYNEQGQLVRQQDANRHVTRYEYETCCQRSATVLPLGQRSTTQYNQVNNVSSVTDFNGRTISFGYDVNNRLKTKSFPDGTSVQFAYTATGRRRAITDRRGVTTFEYDDRDRVLKRTDPDGRFVAYTYDAAGNRTSVRTATGTTLYAFDELNRLTSVTDTEGGITRYIYNEAHNVARMELPNGTVRVNAYDSLNRVNDIQHLGPGGVFASFQYTMGPTGNRTQVREPNGRVVSYTYDALYRLVREAITDPVAGNRTISYTMDPVGNRLTRDDSGEGVTAYTYDANDQLLTETLAGITTSYGYDANGNNLYRSNANETTEYDWDAENHLVGFRRFDPSHSPLVTGHYAYDDDGIRVSSTVTETGNTETTIYLIDANRPYAQVLEEWRSLNTQPATLNASYTYGPHNPISQRRTGVWSYYHADHLGSTRVLTDVSGTLTDQYALDAYGREIHHSGVSENSYLFAGEQRDRQLGLDYLRARFLRIEAGRFWARDRMQPRPSLPSSLNPYLYADASPIANLDPSGNVTLTEAMATVAIISTVYTIAQRTAGTIFNERYAAGKQVEWTGKMEQIGIGSPSFGWGPEGDFIGIKAVSKCDVTQPETTQTEASWLILAVGGAFSISSVPILGAAGVTYTISDVTLHSPAIFGADAGALTGGFVYGGFSVVTGVGFSKSRFSMGFGHGETTILPTPTWGWAISAVDVLFGISLLGAQLEEPCGATPIF